VVPRNDLQAEGATQCGVAALITSKASGDADDADPFGIFSGIGAFYDCAALLGGNGHWPDIAVRAVLLSA
jgi:hypothetical protein